MYFAIIDMLQDSTVAETVREILNYARQKDEAVLKQLFLQFVIHRLGKSFTLAIKELENWNEDEETFVDLLLNIYKSDSTESEKINEKTTKQFIDVFFIEMVAQDFLPSDLLSDTVKFLETIVKHRFIPKNSIFHVNTLFMMSALLNPILRLKKACRVDNESLRSSLEDLGSSIEIAIKIFMEHIPTGFGSKRLGCWIAGEFITAVEKHFDELGNVSNFLKSYRTLLTQENNTMHAMALKSLTNLCEIEDISDELRDILFDNHMEEDDEENENFMSILEELVQRKNLKAEAISVLIGMNEIRGDHELLSRVKRQEIYFNLFKRNSKVVEESVNLIRALGDDFWMEAFKLLEKFGSEDIDLSKFVEVVKSIEDIDCSSETLNKMVLESLETPKISRVAALIFTEFLKKDKESIVASLATLHLDLHECFKDQETFGIFLETLYIAGKENVSSFYSTHHVETAALFSCLAEAFERFQEPVVLYSIVNAMNQIYNLSQEFFIKKLREIFLKKHSNMLAIFKISQKKVTSEYLEPVTKLAILLENESWNLMNQIQMEQSFFMAYILCSESNNRLFPILSRYLANFLKHISARLLLKRPVTFVHNENISDIIKSFADTARYSLENDLTLKKAHLLISVYMDLLLMFQPAKKSKHKFFASAIIDIDKNEVLAIATLVENYLDVKDRAAKYKREIVLNSFTNFITKYENLPSRTACWHVIRFYSSKYEFKEYVEILLAHTLDINVFDQVIAFAVLNFANLNLLSEFRVFLNGIQRFLLQRYDGNSPKQFAKIGTVASTILSKLPAHIASLEDGNYDDRLMSLDFVLMMVNDSNLKKKLLEFIPANLESGLNHAELKHLNKFKKSLIGSDDK